MFIYNIGGIMSRRGARKSKIKKRITREIKSKVLFTMADVPGFSKIRERVRG